MEIPFEVDETRRNYRTIRERTSPAGAAPARRMRNPGLTNRNAFETLARAAEGRGSGRLARRCGAIRR
jgi:hypothetical protein